MATSFKAQSIAHELADRLKARGIVLVESFDTDSNPLITIGDGVAGHQNALVKVLPLNWPLAKDVLGNTAFQYTPHVVQLGTETDAGGSSSVLTIANLMPILQQSGDMGCRVEWYESANGVAPTAAILGDATKLKASYDPDLYHPVINGQ